MKRENTTQNSPKHTLQVIQDTVVYLELPFLNLELALCGWHKTASSKVELDLVHTLTKDEHWAQAQYIGFSRQVHLTLLSQPRRRRIPSTAEDTTT